MENERNNQELEEKIVQELMQDAEQETGLGRSAGEGDAKKEARKLKRQQKKQQKKQLCRDVRQRKKDEFRAKGPLGMVFWALGRVIYVVFLALLIITVVEVNSGKVMEFIVEMQLEKAMSTDQVGTVTQEELASIMPADEEGAAAIEALPGHGEEETWAIYMYIIGSDLEAKTNGQLSEATRFYAGLKAQEFQQESAAKSRAMLVGLMEDMQANGMDLPNFFYEKAIPDDSSNALVEQVEQTVAKNDSHAASADIEEMLAVTLPENVKIILQAGGAGNWAYEKINPNRTQRLLYDSEGMRVVNDGPLSNMSDTESLVDFLRYCKNEHPADHTMYVFWNHGAGAFGYGVNQIYGNDDLSLADMREAFATVYEPDEENPPIDVIGFDACLMASMEVANTFHGFASYLLGSEDTEPGFGWDYTGWLGRVAENPQMNGAQLGKAVTDSYLEFYSRYALAYGKTAKELFSVIDLKYADDLYAAYDALAAAALKDIAENPSMAAMLGQAANRSIKYSGGFHTVQNTMDLGMFMDEIMEYYPNEAGAVRELVDQAVVYSLASDAVAESQGITVYYPSAISSLSGVKYCIDYVDNISVSPNISALYYYKMAGYLRSDMQEYVQSQGYGEIRPMDTAVLKAMEDTEITFLEDGNYVAAANEEAVANAQTIGYNLLQVQDGMARSLGRSSFLLLTEENDLQTAYDGTWLFIDGQPFALDMLSYTDDVLSFTSEIKFEEAMGAVDAYLLVSYDFEEEKWGIMGVQQKEDIDTQQDIAMRNTTELTYGDVITPVYEAYDMETGLGSIVSGEAIEYEEGTKIEERTLENGDYISYISITDARGDLYELPAVAFTMKGGKLRDAKLDESGIFE